MRTLVLALALFFSLAAPAPAQQSFQFKGGSLSGDMVLPITWEGKPAFLLVTGGAAGTRSLAHFIVPYRGWGGWDGKPFAHSSFRLVAGFFQDTRPCAPGSPVFVSVEDFWGTKLGDLGANGTLTWNGTPGPRVFKTAYSGAETWFTGYCDHWCYGKCRPGYSDGPEFRALVLVIE